MIATFSLDSFRITETRSLHNDTDFVSVGVTVGTKAAVTQTRAMGDVNNGTYQVGLSVSADIPNDNTPVVFSYAIVNNGHSDHATLQKELEGALTTLGNAGAKAAASAVGGAIGAALGASLGTAAVPIIGTALGALSGWLVGEIGSILFANCDGPVAAGVRIYTGAQLMQDTAGGQKLTETVEHPGTDSPTGCGSNSVYFTTDTVSTAPAIQTLIDLNGQWAAGGTPGPVISVSGNAISIDMSAYHRPTATGSITNSTNITANFPDDKSYTATLEQPGTIKWSNNSTWTKVERKVETAEFRLEPRG
jgi:hypothetical protein